MIPKSIAAIVPSGSTNRFPWCMSAWKNPASIAWVRKTSTSRRAMSGRSWPAALSASISPILMPSIHSRVITRPVVRSQSIAGTQ